MSRTTINIDTPVLRDLKRLQKEQKRPLGTIISELLAQALTRLNSRKTTPTSFSWTSKKMKALVDLDDKEALHRILTKYS